MPEKPSIFGCPECGGVLWEIEQKGLLRFRCCVGHAYTADHLRAEQRFVVETALWAALRALEESASLSRRLADRARACGLSTMAMFEDRAATAEHNSRTLRDFLVNVNAAPMTRKRKNLILMQPDFAWKLSKLSPKSKG